ncbi:MAG: YceI family protein, partial [Bacteroidota bacterium]
FLLDGVLTLRGISKPVVLDVVYRGPASMERLGTRAGFRATATIQRSEWGMTWGMYASGAQGASVPVVADEVEIVLDVEAIAQD